MALLVGEYEAAIDAKRRLAVCSAIREQISGEVDGENFYMILGPDRHLWMYPDRYYRKLVATMKRSPLPNRQLLCAAAMSRGFPHHRAGGPPVLSQRGPS